MRTNAWKVTKEILPTDWRKDLIEPGYTVYIPQKEHGLSNGLVVACYDMNGKISGTAVISTLNDDVTISLPTFESAKLVKKVIIFG